MMSKNSRIPLKELLLSLLPITAIGKAMYLGVIIWFVNWVFGDGQTLFGSVILKRVVDIGSALAFIPFVYFLYTGAGWVKEHLLWRLRRRLIVTYLLIGALPLLLLVFLMGLIGYAVATQSSVGLVSRKFDSYLEQSRAVARALGRDLNSTEMSQLPADELRQRLQVRANALAAIFPEISLSVRQKPQDGGAVSVKGIGAEPPPILNPPVPIPDYDAPLPQWLNDRGSFDGLVLEEGQTRQLYVRHVIKFSDPATGIFQLSYPISRLLCANLGQTVNLDVRPGLGLTTAVMTPNGPHLGNEMSTGGRYPIFKFVTDWSTGLEVEREALLLDPTFMTPAHIWGRVQQFKSDSFVGKTVFLVISILAVFLMLIALGAIISAIFLTRSITRAVHYLYQGTKLVEMGELDHEIPIIGNDQLGELTGSFNRMTRSVRELLRVSVQKQRLDQEMKIAAQVQTRLFPRSLPQTNALDFAPGICIPARSVSGDYYDFFEVAPGRTGVVVADVCGKGVSAALMMANLQANLRGQVQAYHDAHDYKLALAAQSGGSPQTGESISQASDLQLL